MDTVRVSTFSLLCLIAGPLCPSMAEPVVEVEEVLTKYEPANNGAGPMWCYGSTCIARQGDDVYASTIETGKDVPPLCNCRWQLWHRSSDGWNLVRSERQFRQREPCPVGIFPDSSLFLSINPSSRPPGEQYGKCHPHVLEFHLKDLDAPFKIDEPDWADGTAFTDHSYRGLAADGARGELLLLHINAQTSQQFVSYRDATGRWHEKGAITFPIRACYPQVALRDHAAHVLAIGDIVEPVKEWKELKYRKTKREWDYVFRRLFYTYTPDVTTTPFMKPIEIASVDSTGGTIMNLDLYVDADNAAHLLYTKEPYASPQIHDAYFSDQPRTKHLEYAIVKDGKVISRRVLVENVKATDRITPNWARFHVAPGPEFYVVLAGTLQDEKGKVSQENFIGKVEPDASQTVFHRLDMKKPFTGAFFTATPRAGTPYSDVIDMMGTSGDPYTLRYARIRIK